MRRASISVVTFAVAFVGAVHADRGAFAFNLPSLPSFFNFPPATPVVNTVDQKKAELIDAISNTNNGKTASPETQAKVLRLVRDIEKAAPTSETLLSNPEEAKALDGVWYLQYTSPSVLGDEDLEPDAWKPEFASEGEVKIDTKRFEAKGTVTAQGIAVDTANRVTKQSFDVAKTTVTNEVEQDFGLVRVSGTFRQSEKVPIRAIVAFQDLEIVLTSGLTLNLGFIFSILGLLRGTKESGWLETTYLGEDMRIGRGNKGTTFVLTRDQNAVKP